MNSESTDSKPKVYITKNGGRYVKSEEYFKHPRVVQVLDRFSNLKISTDSTDKSKDVQSKSG